MVWKRIASGCRSDSRKILSSFLFLWLASCSSQDDQFDKQMDGILSWSATAEMILDGRLGAEVPKGFTDLALERCQQEISNLSSQLPQTSRFGDARASVLQLNRLIAAAYGEVGQDRFERGRQHLAALHQYEAKLRNTYRPDG